MADDTTQVVGTIPDTKAYSKTRRDERFILIEQRNIELDSGNEYTVLDEMEAGDLQSIKITVDNPYVQVLLQIDDFRNKDPSGQCPAEIIYNGNSDNTNRSFKVIDGQGSSKGYTMEYKPDQPEEYNKRLRVVIRNSIKPSTSVFGMGLNYTSAGNLPTPAVPSHMAGGTFSHPAFEALSLSQIARAMTKPVGVSGYASTNVYNESAIMNDSIELGSDHPYEGIAGQPTFVRDKTCEAFMESVEVLANNNFAPSQGPAFIHHKCVIVDEPEGFPGSSGTPSQMVVEIVPELQQLPGLVTPTTKVHGYGGNQWYGISTIRKSDLQAEGPFGDTWPGTSTYTPFTGSTTGDTTTNALDGTVLPAAETIIGKRMFIRRGGTIYFPGTVKSVTKRLAPMALFGGTTVGLGAEIDTTNGIGRALDPDNANKLNTETTYFPVGAYGVGAVGTPVAGGAAGAADTVIANPFIVMPFFNSNGKTSLEGVKIAEGTANEITLTAGGDDDLLKARSSATATGTYEVFMAPGTPWIYTFTFEPGVTSSPIDFHTVYENEEDSLLAGNLSGVAFASSVQPNFTSTGIYAGDTTVSTGDDFARGLAPASEANSWGTVTTQADDNPKVLIKSIEVKRNKRISYEG
jgi:hypothetical protein